MTAIDTVIAVYPDHGSAGAAIKKLGDAGFPMTSLTLIGKGYQTDEKVVGFYNVGDRIKLWGTRGAFWGGLWGLMFGGVFLSAPVIGPVIVLGYLASAVIATLEGAAVLGGLSALGAALFSIGVPKDSVVRYQTDLRADDFLVMVHGSADDAKRAEAILGTTGPSRIDTHAAKIAADGRTVR
jgi:hypothetical protein